MWSVISVFPVSAFAQSASGNKEKVSFGLRTGLNISSLGGDLEQLIPNSKVNSRTGFHIGVIVDVPVNNRDPAFRMRNLSVTAGYTF